MTDPKAKLREPHTHTEFRDMSARGVRGFLRSSLALLLGLGLIGCGSSAPTPAHPTSSESARGLKVLGTVKVTIDEGNSSEVIFIPNTSLQNQTVIADNNVIPQLTVNGVCKGVNNAQNTYRIGACTFELLNNTTQPYSNLAQYFVGNPNRIGGTTFTELKTSAGALITDASMARSMLPSAPADTVLDSNGQVKFLYSASDFQVLTPAEARQLTLESVAVGGDPNSRVLEYGARVRAADGGRTLLPGSKGTMTIGWKRPWLGDQTIRQWQYTMILAVDPTGRITRAPGETTASAVARAQAVGATEVGFVGIDSDVAPVALKTVRNCDPLFYVGQTTTPCPTPLPVSLSIASRVGTVNQAMSFDAAGSEGDSATTYAWDFGDGSSSTSGYTSHTYTAPGKYTVNETTTTAGQSSSAQAVIAVLPEMKSISTNLNAMGKDAVHFDAGQPVPGLSYEWDFGDTTTGNGSVIDHSFPKLGTYEVYLTIKDSQPLNGQSVNLGSISARSSGGNTLQAQALSPVLAFKGYTWVTRWDPRPQAIFTSTNGTTQGYTVGFAPLALSFDASGSLGWNANLITMDNTLLTYTWDFGDGQTGTGRQVSHTFQNSGQYIVTLNVFDAKGQQEQAQTFVAARGAGVFLRTSFNYPTLTGQSVESDPFGGRVGRIRSTASESLSAQSVPIYEDYFPYVIHKSARVGRLSARWNDWSNAGNYGTGSQCQSLAVYYNQSVVQPFIQFERNGTDGVVCDFMTLTGSSVGPLAARGQSDLFVQASVSFQRLNFQVFSGLRVPQVALAILPDRMIPGELASPFVNVNTVVNDNTGKTELIETVQARQSEVKNGILEFKVPVYAVNDAGQLISTANGFFKGRFENMTLNESDCGDCVMVNGKAYFTVKISVAGYGPTNKLVDLSKIKLQTNLASCASDSSPWQGIYAITGCTSIVTSTEAPTGNENVKPIKYKLPPYSFILMNRLIVGKSPQEVQRIMDENEQAFYQDIKNFVVDNMIPFYSSGKALVEVVSLCAQQHQCNAGAILLSGVAVIADVLPVTKALAAPLRYASTASRIEARVLAGAIDEAILPKVLTKAPIEDVVVDLDRIAGNTSKAIKECGQSCVTTTENTIKKLTDKGISQKDAIAQFEDKVSVAKSKNIKAEFQTTYAKIATTCTRSFLGLSVKPSNVFSAQAAANPVFCDGVNIAHLFEGQFKLGQTGARQGFVGYHYAGPNWPKPSYVQITGSKGPLDSFGAYRARIEWEKTPGVGDFKPKGGDALKDGNSFFPDNWTPQEVHDEIVGAFINGSFPDPNIPRLWRGTSPRGMNIEGFVDVPNVKGPTAGIYPGYIDTAYPILPPLPPLPLPLPLPLP